jgi:SAM-dependent methyltransferase
MTRREYLKSLGRSWDAYGAQDPLWAILVDPAKRNNRWDEDEFFALGERSAGELMRWCAQRGLPARRDACLDFGCGVGRLTQALAAHFRRAVGVDIAPSMVEKARAYNRHGERCQYVVNQEDGLPLLASASFDLVYTEFVLQHMHPALSSRYILEMIRVLAPGGLLCFQLPERLPVLVYPGNMAAKVTAGRESLVVRAGGTALLELTVANTGDGVWDPEGNPKTPVRVCHHWWDINSGALLLSHGHQTLAGAVRPGEKVRVNYQAAAPALPGHYVCLIDLMDFNGVTFMSRGVPPLGLETAVSLPARPPRPKAASSGGAAALTAPGPRPAMEMHAIPVEAVTALIAGAGGTLLERQRTGGRQDEIGHARYFVTR